jgi:hypothetical protein
MAEAYREASVIDELVTRLGDGSVTVEAPGLRSPFTDTEIATLPVPLRWLRSISQEPYPAIISGSLIAFGELRMSYTRLGLKRFGLPCPYHRL